MSGSAGISVLVILLAQAGVVAPDQVEIDLGRYQQMIAEPEPEPGFAWAQHRELKLELSDEGVLLRGRWTILGHGPTSDFLDDLLPGDARIERARWNGAPAGLWTTGDRVTAGRCSRATSTS